MKIIKTIAPIPIDELKQFFVDKDIKFVIDYKNSKLQGSKLLIYLSNLDIPCDIDIDDDQNAAFELLTEYLNSHFLVSIELLEKLALEAVLCYKKILVNANFDKFVEDNLEILERWSDILNSLALYNISTVSIPELKKQLNQFEVNNDDSSKGINFVNLLKHEVFYNFFSSFDKSKLKYYSNFFENSVFKGKNLYHYWANENNTMFILTWSIANPNIDLDKFDSIFETIRQKTQ